MKNQWRSTNDRNKLKSKYRFVGVDFMRRIQQITLPGLALNGRHTAPEGASCIAQGERYSANPGIRCFLHLFIVPDATGRGQARGPVRHRTTRTRGRASRSKPSSRNGAASASGVRHDYRRSAKTRTQGSPEYGLTLGYPRRPFRGCVPALQREAGEANLFVFNAETAPRQHGHFNL